MSELPMQVTSDLATLHAIDEHDRLPVESFVANLRSRTTPGPMPLVIDAGNRLASTAMTAWAATLFAGVVVIVAALHVPLGWYIEREQLLYWLWGGRNGGYGSGGGDQLPIITLAAAAAIGTLVALLAKTPPVRKSLAIHVAGPVAFVVMTVVIVGLWNGARLVSGPSGGADWSWYEYYRDGGTEWTDWQNGHDRLRDLTIIVPFVAALSIVVARLHARGSRIVRALARPIVTRFALAATGINIALCFIVVPAINLGFVLVAPAGSIYAASSSQLTALTIWLAATSFVATFGVVAK
jgi:hypothetical protein